MYVAGISFLLAVAATDALVYPEHIQRHYLIGTLVLIRNSSLFNLQNSLERAEVALASALAINRSEEATVINNLVAGQFDEINRLNLYLLGLDAYSCITGAIPRARDAVSGSVTMFENCVNENLTDLRELIDNLTSLQLPYKYQFVDKGPSVIERCASDALGSSNEEQTASFCVEKYLEYFYAASNEMDAVLLSVEERIKQALRIILTCTERARTNATFSVNAILKSIRVCVESYGIKVKIKVFSNYVDHLSDCVSYLSIFDLTVTEETYVGILKATEMLVFGLRKTYEQGTQANLSFATGLAEHNFILEIGVIKNASLLTNLTTEQTGCVATAISDMETVINEGGTEWVNCAKNSSSQLYPELLAVEKLNASIHERCKTHGIAAFMKCITKNTANATAAINCITSAYNSFQDYLQSVHTTEENRYRKHILPLGQCRKNFLKNTKIELDRIVTTLKACVPQVSIPEIYF